MDDRFTYIICHLMTILKNLIVFGAIVALAFYLKSGWVLWAFVICPWTRYKHDFNKR